MSSASTTALVGARRRRGALAAGVLLLADSEDFTAGVSAMGSCCDTTTLDSAIASRSRDNPNEAGPFSAGTSAREVSGSVDDEAPQASSKLEDIAESEIV